MCFALYRPVFHGGCIVSSLLDFIVLVYLLQVVMDEESSSKQLKVNDHQ